jgi:hypothetical protein
MLTDSANFTENRWCTTPQELLKVASSNYKQRLQDSQVLKMIYK